jgi:signal transduction histidine kinase
MRYFTLATLGVFAAAGVALFLLQRMEERFFEQVQRQQQVLFAKSQIELARQNERAARESLVAVHEAGHVTLTRVVANLLWASDFAPLVARAQALSIEPCRVRGQAPGTPPSAAQRACQAGLGRRIMALPGFGTLDAKAYAAMRNTRVFKIKVWDLRGVAVYSSEHAQIGEDGAHNMGRRAAAGGQPASELTHRDRFSAFEGVVEDRDLISTYVPVHDDRSGAVVGVFELYSDVTPFLAQTRAAAKAFADIAAANEAEVARNSRQDHDTLYESSQHFLLTVGGLLALLYAASLVIVRIGQRYIDRQMREQEQAALREQQWHQEKMAALAAMAANVTHEVGNPLAVIAGLAQQLPAAAGGEAADAPGRQILEQSARIAQMMRQISDFASARGGAPEWVDVNALLKAVCDFQSFDRRFRGISIELRPVPQLPACELVPDHLSEVTMGLLQVCADSARDGASEGASPRIVVEPRRRGTELEIRISGHAGDPLTGSDARVEPVRRRLAAMGGRLASSRGVLEIVLPLSVTGAPAPGA